MTRRRPTLLDEAIADVQDRIARHRTEGEFLQQERANLLRIKAAHATPAPRSKPTRIAAVDPEKAS